MADNDDIEDEDYVDWNEDENENISGVLIIEPRCKVCQHPQRRAIDKLLSIRTSFAEIERIFDVPARSASSHLENHLNYEDAAVRRLVDKEIELSKQDTEEGIVGSMNRRVYLQIAIQKATESLLKGDVKVTPKDAVAIVELLDKLDHEATGADVDTYQKQFNAFVQAIREIAPAQMWDRITARTREILTGKVELDPPDET